MQLPQSIGQGFRQVCHPGHLFFHPGCHLPGEFFAVRYLALRRLAIRGLGDRLKAR